MDAVYAASGDDRPELSMLSDPQAVVEAILQTVMGHEPDLSDVPAHTQTLIAASCATLEPLTEESATVADTARCVAAIFALIADNEAQARTEVPNPDLPEQPDLPDQAQQQQSAAGDGR